MIAQGAWPKVVPPCRSCGRKSMSKYERRQFIINYLMSENIVPVSKLISMIDQSPATIRRDLAFLEKNGYIERSHGYVKYIPPAIVKNLEISEGKRRVAKVAASLIPKNATIFLDSGISTKALAMEITSRDDICVYTNSISVANVLAFSKVVTYLACGMLEGRQEALVGSDTEHFVRQHRFPILFLSTTGIRPNKGLACVTAEQANLKAALIESSEKVILLTEKYKFSIDSVRLFASFDQLDTIIVEEPLDDPEMEATLKANNVELLVAPSEL